MRKGQRSRARTAEPATKQQHDEPKENAVKVLHLTDLHFPFHNPHSIERVLDHIESEQFDVIVHGGDGIDAYSVSKYDPDPARITTLQSELDEQAEFLARVNKLQPDTRKVYLVGNHEERIPAYVRRKGPALESLRCLKLPELLQTKQNGWELHGREGILIRDTRYKHGNKVATGSGNSVLKELGDHWRNVVMGHCHRSAIRTVRKDDRVFTGVEGGGCFHPKPEYIAFPDWVNAHYTMEHHSCGMMVAKEHRH